MRVICIENSILIDKDKPDFGSVYAHKGSIYNVINILQGEEMSKIRGRNYASGDWYEFLELQGMYHHHIRFLEIPDDDYDYSPNKIEYPVNLNE